MNVKDFKDHFINKIVRVTTRNQRVFYGRLAAVDEKANVLLYETAA
jgi:small nuclear ribonucleoprotein (snRNP)-like protein